MSGRDSIVTHYSPVISTSGIAPALKPATNNHSHPAAGMVRKSVAVKAMPTMKPNNPIGGASFGGYNFTQQKTLAEVHTAAVSEPEKSEESDLDSADKNLVSEIATEVKYESSDRNFAGNAKSVMSYLTGEFKLFPGYASKAINIIAIVGLLYGVVTIYQVNQRSKMAYQERQSASQAAERAEYDFIEIAKANEVRPAVSTLVDSQGLQPATFSIDKIGVNAIVENMGLTADNHIEAPQNNYNVGWYEQSAALGQQGATIIDGHLGSNIEPAVFRDLEKLEAGDQITVQAQNGQSFQYVVRLTEVVDKNSTNFDKFYQPIGSNSGLNIITCSGGYLQDEDTYESRLIVYAEQVFA